MTAESRQTPVGRRAAVQAGTELYQTLSVPTTRPRHDPPAWPFASSCGSTPTAWPVEHPLDFDWRFDRATTHYLQGLVRAESPVALLGTPTLANQAHRRGGEVTLFDRNPAVVAAARAALPGVVAAEVDLVWGPPVPPAAAAVAVLDPPWYPEHTAGFLWTAARLTRPGGRVYLSLPPVETRPGIPAERDDAFAAAAAFGLRPAAVIPGVLGYRTPMFERNALLAAGVRVVSDHWRRGDLAVFDALGWTGHPRPRPPASRDGWDEVAVGAVRIKCRASRCDLFRDPTLTPAAPGGILASVSRRHPTRAVVSVWTSGNRVFRCVGPGILRLVLSALESGASAASVVRAEIGRDLTATEVLQIRRATHQSAALVTLETRELSGHGGFFR